MLPGCQELVYYGGQNRRDGLAARDDYCEHAELDLARRHLQALLVLGRDITNQIRSVGSGSQALRDLVPRSLDYHIDILERRLGRSRLQNRVQWRKELQRPRNNHRLETQHNLNLYTHPLHSQALKRRPPAQIPDDNKRRVVEPLNHTQHRRAPGRRGRLPPHLVHEQVGVPCE